MSIFVVQEFLIELLDHLRTPNRLYGNKIEIKREDIFCNIPTGLFLGVTEEFHESFSQNVSAASRTEYL
jgi:hypothetical protein